MKEPKWKFVVGFEKTHKVSSEGDIMKYSSNAVNFKGPFLLKVNKQSSDYRKKPVLMITLQDGIKRKVTTVARVVAEAFIPNPNNYRWVIHKNNNSLDNRVENLYWSSRAQNDNHIKIVSSNGNIYESLSQACKEENISRETLRNLCNTNLEFNNKSFEYLDKKHEYNFNVTDLEGEQWLPIQGTNKQYFISNKGRVKSKPRKCQIAYSYGEKLVKGKVLNGKLRINIRTYIKGKPKRKYLTVCYEVAKAFRNAELKNKEVTNVYNKNGNPYDNTLENIGIR